jgi:branched-chain amino acid transport system substrate-binding protein
VGGNTRSIAPPSYWMLNGQMKLDSNRQAIGTSFVTEAVKDANGDLVSKVVQVVPNVNQTLGIDPAAFAKIGLPAR